MIRIFQTIILMLKMVSDLSPFLSQTCWHLHPQVRSLSTGGRPLSTLCLPFYGSDGKTQIVADWWTHTWLLITCVKTGWASGVYIKMSVFKNLYRPLAAGGMHYYMWNNIDDGVFSGVSPFLCRVKWGYGPAGLQLFPEGSKALKSPWKPNKLTN